MFELDFSEKDHGDKSSLSKEDRKFLEMGKNGVRHLPDGHYEIQLPVKDKNLTLPNNCAMALNRPTLKFRLDRY